VAAHLVPADLVAGAQAALDVHAVTDAQVLTRDHLVSVEETLDAARFDDGVAAVDAFHHAVDEVFLAVEKVADDLFALGVADLLQDDLLRRLRADTAEFDRLERFLDEILELERGIALERLGQRDLARLTQPQREGERIIKGLNFFERSEQQLLRALQRLEFNIHGMRRADLKPFVSGLSDSRLSRQLHRLRSIGLIKRVTRSYRYYLTRLGRAAIAAACSLTQFNIVPALAHAR